jgi:hypothetical protein
MYCRTDDICNPSLEIVSIKLEKELNIRIYHKIKSTELLYLETKKISHTDNQSHINYPYNSKSGKNCKRHDQDSRMYIVPTSRNFAKSDPGIAEVQWSTVPVTTVFSDILFPAEMHNQQLQERTYICFKKRKNIY